MLNTILAEAESKMEKSVENTKEKNQKILALNSMQSVTSDDVKNGETYLNVMQSNLDVLKQALN